MTRLQRARALATANRWMNMGDKHLWGLELRWDHVLTTTADLCRTMASLALDGYPARTTKGRPR